MSIRPRRSVLYMPGSNARALEKARTIPADGLILDMEDAVSPDAKQEARDQITAAVGQGGYGNRELIVRVNALSTDWGHDDVKAVAKLPVNAVLFPKVESAAEVLAAVEALDAAGGPPDLPVWIMSETPRGILSIDEITQASKRLGCIVMGTSDLAKDMRLRHTPSRTGFITSLSMCLLAARANGLEIVDGVYLDLKDDEGFKNACIQGREMGFDGKTLIHPKQVEPANEVFAPPAAEVENARAIIAAWDEAQAAGKGVCVVNGRLIENLHVEEAKRALALAEAIEGLAG